MPSIGYVPRLFAKVAFVLATAAASTAGAQGAALNEANDEQKQIASEAFSAGMEASGSGDYKKALESFQESFDAVASPNSHLMVARTLVQLGRLLEARAAFEATIEEGIAAGHLDHKYLETAEAAKKDLAELDAQLASVEVKVVGAAAGDKVRVGDRELDPEALGAPILVEISTPL